MIQCCPSKIKKENLVENLGICVLEKVSYRFGKNTGNFKTIVQPLSATPGEKDSGYLEGAGRLIEIKPIEKLPLGL